MIDKKIFLIVLIALVGVLFLAGNVFASVDKDFPCNKSGWEVTDVKIIDNKLNVDVNYPGEFYRVCDKSDTRGLFVVALFINEEDVGNYTEDSLKTQFDMWVGKKLRQRGSDADESEGFLTSVNKDHSFVWSAGFKNSYIDIIKQKPPMGFNNEITYSFDIPDFEVHSVVTYLVDHCGLWSSFNNYPNMFTSKKGATAKAFFLLYIKYISIFLHYATC